MINFSDVTVRVSGTGTDIFHNVSFSMSKGEIGVITGESGSGKTTIARCVLGSTGNSVEVTGDISVDGIDPRSLNARALRRYRRHSVGFVDQDPGTSLNPGHSVGKILSELEKETGSGLEWARALGLTVDECFLRRRPPQLSGGQLRRVSLARHAAASPSLLIVDEPSAGLDSEARSLLVHELRHLHEKLDGSLLIITHDLELLMMVDPDHHWTLSEGTLSTGSPSAVPATVPRMPRVPEHAALDVSGLTAGFPGSAPVCRMLDFSVGAGEAVGLTGPSGCGKTTVARAVLGLLPPLAGSVKLDGKLVDAEVHRRSLPERQFFGYIAQDSSRSLNPRVPVGRVLAHALQVSRPRSAPPTSPRTVDELLTGVGLGPDLASRRPGQLSGGQRQRVCLARALALSPTVLICDEATAAVDRGTQSVLLELLAHLRDDGLGLLVVSHDDVVIGTLCDRLIRLEPVGSSSASSQRKGSGGISVEEDPGCRELPTRAARGDYP